MSLTPLEWFLVFTVVNVVLSIIIKVVECTFFRKQVNINIAGEAGTNAKRLVQQV